MNILFVVPPYRTADPLVAQLYPMPLGPVMLGTVLQNAGHTVTIKDFTIPSTRHTLDEQPFPGEGAPPYYHYGSPMKVCAGWLRGNAEEYDVVCLAMCQCNINETAGELGRLISSLDIPLVIGGPYVTTAPAEAQRKTGAQVVVMGEGEGVVVEAVVKAVQVGSNAEFAPPTIFAGQQMHPQDLPVPNWGLAPPTNYPKYNGKVRGVLTVSRGCPHKCTFCSVHTIMGRDYRRLDREHIKFEMERLFERGVRYFCFLDDNLFINTPATKDILWVIKRLDQKLTGFDKCRFYVEEGVEVRMAKEPGFFKHVAAARFDNIAIGLETLNPATLQDVHKPYDTEDMLDAVMYARNAGVVAKAFYIIGFPRDTITSVAQDIVAFGKLGLAVRPNNLKLYPGTELTKDAMRAGLITKDYDWRRSCWHTPHLGGIYYKDIKRYKTILRAVGMAAEDFGVRLLLDDWMSLVRAFAAKGYTLSQTGKEEITLTGNMFRPSSYRHIAALLLMNYVGCGAETKLYNTGSDNKSHTKVVATVCEPDEIQQALLAAMHPDTYTAPTPEGFGI